MAAATNSIVNIDESEKRYAVNIGFFNPGKPQAWFDLDVAPQIDGNGTLIIYVNETETIAFAHGNWSGLSVKDRGVAAEPVDG